MQKKPQPEPAIVSRPYSPKACCEKCVFGSGSHETWCQDYRISETLDEIDRICALAEKEESDARHHAG